MKPQVNMAKKPLRLCAECKQRKPEHRTYMSLVNGQILWCCYACWKRLELDAYMHEDKCGCPHCQVCKQQLVGV